MEIFTKAFCSTTFVLYDYIDSISQIPDPKYQIVIPSEIRSKLSFKLEPGQKLEVTAHKRHIELHPILSPDQIIGFLKGPDPIEFERDGDRRL